jgi:hypothetical protein
MKLRLLAVLAHPDDESLGFGGTLARYAAEGVETYLVTATRGERGRFGSLGKSGDPVEVGRVREAELREAAAVLGIREVSILSYPDGAVDEVPAAIAIRAIASHIRRIQPHVIVTFGPDGATGIPTTLQSRNSRLRPPCAPPIPRIALSRDLKRIRLLRTACRSCSTWHGETTNGRLIRPPFAG